MREGHVHQLADAVRLPGGNHVVVRLVLLEHQPHRLDVVLGVAPVALGVEVAQRQVAGQAELDGGGAVRDFACHKFQPATLRFMVKQYSGTRK